MSADELEEAGNLILAAEDCEPTKFEQLHRFSKTDQFIIAKLMAHGPVLLRGGRGSGKSALMIEASRRLWPATTDAGACGLYISMRHLELLRTRAGKYRGFFCNLVINEVRKQLGDEFDYDSTEASVTSLQGVLADVTMRLNKRIVLFFDDAAHIGREASLEDFFDIFRTISSAAVSCKAAIYPGVTQFGIRFDVFNDATIVDVSRSEELADFGPVFTEIMQARYAASLTDELFTRTLPREEVASFLGQAVLGNMRAFVFACNTLSAQVRNRPIGLPELTATLLALANNHFWPLLDELKPKLGIYESMIEPATTIANIIFERCGKATGSPRSALIHRDVTEGLAKPFEILEYVGFMTRREASRALKSGGRGARFALNLCSLLEKTPGARVTSELFQKWTKDKIEPLEFHQRGLDFVDVQLPQKQEDAELAILAEPIASLRKSNAYPYGLTANKINALETAGIHTVRELANASDADLLHIPTIGERFLRRIRNVVGQAVWM